MKTSSKFQMMLFLAFLIGAGSLQAQNFDKKKHKKRTSIYREMTPSDVANNQNRNFEIVKKGSNTHNSSTSEMNGRVSMIPQKKGKKNTEPTVVGYRENFNSQALKVAKNKSGKTKVITKRGMVRHEFGTSRSCTDPRFIKASKVVLLSDKGHIFNRTTNGDLQEVTKLYNRLNNGGGGPGGAVICTDENGKWTSIEEHCGICDHGCIEFIRVAVQNLSDKN